MFIMTKDKRKYLHICARNFHALYWAESRGNNLCCSLQGEVNSLGSYPELSGEAKDAAFDFMCRLIHDKIDYESFTFEMPEDGADFQVHL